MNVNAPWVEKYRPQTLDDVAAHTEIVDTSQSCTTVSPSCRVVYQYYSVFRVS